MTTAKTHIFAAFGPGPYRFIGQKTNWFKAGPGDSGKPGGSCDYCGTGIAVEFWFRAANGREFKVGCDCASKYGDAGMKRAVTDAEAARQAEIRKARKARQVKVAAILIAQARDILPSVSALKAEPHPHPYFASQGKTKADYLSFFLCRNDISSARTVLVAAGVDIDAALASAKAAVAADGK